MMVIPLKICAGRHNFRPGDPAMEIADAEAKQLLSDGAVAEVVPTKRKPRVSHGTSKNRDDSEGAGTTG